MPTRIRPNAPPVRRYAIFLRVSTRDQLSGHSPRQQERRAREYIEKCGGKYVKTYGGQESGTSEDRRMLDATLADAGRIYTDLVVQETTRLSRHPGVMFQAMTRLSEAGARLHDLNGPIPFDTPEGEFHLMMQSVIGRFTARQGVEKSINSRIGVLEEGGIAAGRPPWGRRWIKSENRFEVIPEKLDLLKRAYHLITERGYSLNRTADELSVGKNKRFARSSLRKAINQSSQKEVVQHLSGRTYKVPCPPLLTTLQHFKINLRLAENRTSPTRTPSTFLLQGLVRCACGASMTGQKTRKGAYEDATYRHAVDTYSKATCTWGVPARELEAAVYEACGWLIETRQTLRTAIEHALADEVSARGDLDSTRKRLQVEIRDEQSRLDSLVDALGDLPKNGEARRRTQQRIQAAERRLAAKRHELAEIASKLRLLTRPSNNAAAIQRQLHALYPSGSQTRPAPFAKRRAFVQAIVGRTGRESTAGIFVRMFRDEGASKKDVRWSFELNGRFATVQRYVDRTDESYDPEVWRWREPSTDAIKQIAKAARHADVHMGMKCS